MRSYEFIATGTVEVAEESALRSDFLQDLSTSFEHEYDDIDSQTDDSIALIRHAELERPERLIQQALFSYITGFRLRLPSAKHSIPDVAVADAKVAPVDQWEHMALHALERPNDAWQLWTVGAPGYRRQGLDTGDSPSIDEGMRQLDKLGEDGWQLVGTATEPVGNGMTRHSYWLKRRRG